MNMKYLSEEADLKGFLPPDIDFEKLYQQNQIPFYLKKPVKIAACLFLIISLSIGTAAYAIQMRFKEVRHEQASDITLILPETELQLDVISDLYLPEYIPKGYQVSVQSGILHESEFITTIYDGNNSQIWLMQAINSDTFQLDNENVTSKKIIINKKQGIYQVDTQEKIVIWSESNYFFLLKTQNSDSSEKELIKIAESLRRIENEEN